jgi:hypothetical protein
MSTERRNIKVGSEHRFENASRDTGKSFIISKLLLVGNLDKSG